MKSRPAIIHLVKLRVGRWTALALFISALEAHLWAAPTVASVANAASNIPFQSGIAQGSIFVIKGSGLGPASISFAPTPFQSTSLSGTSIRVTVGATSVDAPLYYTSANQVAALLPSNTPTGAGTFSVTYNGQASNALGQTITANNIGVFTIDSSGQGPAIVSYPDYSLVSAVKAPNCGGPGTPCGAAHPGETLMLWGTGLGPVSGNETGGDGLGQAMAAVPLTLWVGGIQAQILYQGRSGCCVGLDQIAFVVPAAVPTGCAVPLVLQIGATAPAISNSSVLPVASGSRNCTPNNAAAGLEASQIPATGALAIGDIDLEKVMSTGGGLQDEAYFAFVSFTFKAGMQPFFQSFADQLPAGVCVVYSSLTPNENIPIDSFSVLDGGSKVTLKGPAGSATVPGPSFNLASFNAGGTFLAPGAYTVTGTGGAAVGPFSATITIPPPPTLTSPLSATNVSRSAGMTVNWKDGDPNGNVLVSLRSAVDSARTTGATARCKVPASAGTFTIPPYVLLALPAGSFTDFVFGTAESETPFTAPGISGGSLHTQSAVSEFTGFPLN